ncbi:MAG: hypothetical protein GC178_18545 [Flavobacteriales bacterium]|nr:hypothetical protein [Flavobacteriales bacterium]
MENYNDIKYDPILEVIPRYFCLTGDTEVIDKLIATMWADKGSANEMPSFSIGDCFICKPDMVAERLNSVSDSEEKKLILNHIEWGLMNHYEVDEDGNSDDQEFERLIEWVNKERRRLSP